MVLDGDGRPGGVIADTERGFGSTRAQVAATAVPFATGLQDGGVAATAKHFPGLGAASENTDFEAQRIGLSKAELRDVDEAPYRVDRMLTQLLQAGWFEGVAGIVLGTWTGCG